MATMQNFAIDEAIDFNTGVRIIGGDVKMFCDLISKLEKVTILPCLMSLKESYETENHINFKEQAHKLKGASGYVAVGRVFYACFQVQDSFNEGDYVRMYSYYPRIIELVCEFLVECHKLLNEKKCKPHLSEC